MLETIACAHAAFCPLAMRVLAKDTRRGQPSPDIAVLPLEKRLDHTLRIVREEGAY